AGPNDEDDVTVQRSSTSRRGIDDPRADLDRPEVRGRDRAEVTGLARVRRALLRYMESSALVGGTCDGGQRPSTETSNHHALHGEKNRAFHSTLLVLLRAR